MDLTKLGLWPIRVMWFVLLGAVGLGFRDIFSQSALDAALEIARESVPSSNDRGAVKSVAEVLLWGSWFVGLVSLLAPSTVALTAFRIVAPAGVVAPVLGAVLAQTWSGPVVGAIGVGLVTTVLAFTSHVGDPMVNGSAYGPERRLALRPPASLATGPIQLAWLLVFAGVVTGPLLLANGNLVTGGLALLIGFGVAIQASRSLHRLSRRWIVFVPAGFVIHDFWVLAESILLRRSQIQALGPAALDVGNYLDLSANSQGLALMVQLDAKVPLALRAKRDIQTFSAHRLVFVPTLPGALLHEARVRGIKIGSEAVPIDE